MNYVWIQLYVLCVLIVRDKLLTISELNRDDLWTRCDGSASLKVMNCMYIGGLHIRISGESEKNVSMFNVLQL